MTSRRALFIDSNVAIFAVGGDHPLRDPCHQLFAAAAAGTVTLHASVELIQEYTFHRLRRSPGSPVTSEARHLMDVLVLHPVDLGVLEGALTLVDDHSIRGKDAIHAATALAAGFDAIVSTDVDFDHIPGLRRIDPGEVV